VKVAPSTDAGVPTLPRPERTFLPVIDRPIDNTAMTSYKTCPREFEFSMVQHRRGEGRSPALVFGSAWHVAMEWHYKTGGNRDRVINEVTNAWEGHDSPDDYRSLGRVFHDYDQYRQKYGEPESPTDEGKTIGAPHDPLVEVSTNALGLGILHPWAGKLDRFIDMGGLIYVEDHKTTSRLDKHYFNQFHLSNQMKGYTFLGQQALPNRVVVGVRINLSHVLTHKTEFHRQIFTFSKPIIEEWVKNENVWLKRLAKDYEMRQAGDPDAFPGHYGDNGCSRKFGMCAYHEVCRSTPRVRQQILEQEFAVNPWNPLEGVQDE
jgi:hypothetical protein